MADKKIPFCRVVQQETTITALVTVTLAVSVCYDQQIPSEAKFREHLLENFAESAKVAAAYDPATRQGLQYQVIQITRQK